MAKFISNQVVRVCLYVTDHFRIKLFMFFLKNYLTRIFVLHQYCMRLAMPKNSEKILT